MFLFSKENNIVFLFFMQQQTTYSAIDSYWVVLTWSALCSLMREIIEITDSTESIHDDDHRLSSKSGVDSPLTPLTNAGDNPPGDYPPAGEKPPKL